MNTRWGIDLGGTKIEAAVLPWEGSEPIARKRIATEAAGGYDHILDRITLLIRDLQLETGLPAPEKIGIGTPGVTDTESGLLKNSNTVCLIGKPLRDDLSARLSAHVELANDANCFALAEATLGAAKGYATTFGVILGTGVGGGLVVDGKVLNGRHGIAGEWGHNVLEPEGPPCYCGKRGCVETVISGTFLTRWYAERSDTPRTLAEVIERARVGEDSVAVATMDHLIESFGKALSVVVNIFDPHAIVLGGGVGNVDELYTRGFDSLSRWVFNDGFRGALLRPTLGDSAGVFGAAMLV
jgi:predicted NBD/HSP70 family sugar kinase